MQRLMDVNEARQRRTMWKCASKNILKHLCILIAFETAGSRILSRRLVDRGCDPHPILFWILAVPNPVAFQRDGPFHEYDAVTDGPPSQRRAFDAKLQKDTGISRKRNDYSQTVITDIL
ncbi:hypothetical protein EVAR_504_1 [Eumeta japonica]|uniref:Uncharacterized protein n=1 Tax=Eumeta variegata TaxID=151549 RepID=A0A4C1SAX2_EUMVA|nr:hypothetical protein EVAR_504_1 [Eumeta japonica]